MMNQVLPQKEKKPVKKHNKSLVQEIDRQYH